MNHGRASKPDVVQPDLFMSPAECESRPDGALPQGFAYAADTVPDALARDLATRFRALPFRNFDFHGFKGNRRIVSYGWKYDYVGRGRLSESEPIPDFLEPLKAAAAAFAGLSAEDFQQALITEYAPGAGIGWHRDKPMFEDVVAFSLLAPCTLRLRHRHGAGWTRRSLDIAPRSAYLLRGSSRFDWEHSIPPLKALRYSITFRSFRPEAQPA